ncbi:HAD-IIA family hydrolase [Intrasporangium calvum]|uniref:HAD-IIA family hydrolase n=1 Tax=Intrasporangium calvum TaxID=53358 RepID=A0ABT5GDT5_9MICO|nr:HAD-IIA family hydrolase [Intrasporangium calvum]MDC5695965.1 HAD-IIA family hydrolase [Intrasporangium calvum]
MNGRTSGQGTLRAEAVERMLAHRAEGPLRGLYAGLVCDLDGVVYRGSRAVPGAPDVLRQLVREGMRIVYATNNASRLPSEVAEHLSELGLPASSPDVVTSAQAGAAALAALLVPGSRVLALGGQGVSAALAEVGLEPVQPARSASGAPPAAVLQGLGRELTVQDFESAARHLADGAVWVATNGDATLPMEWGLAPGNGAYVTLLAQTVGRDPLVVGKPHAPLYQASVERLGTTLEATLAVGDRLDTDIAGAVAAGLDSAWVLTGVHPPSELLRQPEGGVPTWVISHLAELEQPYAAVLRSDDGYTCAGGWARATSEGLDLKPGPADPIELVRAGLAAALDARGSGLLTGVGLGEVAAQLDALLSGSRSG